MDDSTPDIVDRLRAESALAIGAAIAAGRVSSIEVTEWYLKRIAAYSHGIDGLNCVRGISRPREQAGHADGELAAETAQYPARWRK